MVVPTQGLPSMQPGLWPTCWWIAQLLRFSTDVALLHICTLVCYIMPAVMQGLLHLHSYTMLTALERQGLDTVSIPCS